MIPEKLNSIICNIINFDTRPLNIDDGAETIETWDSLAIVQLISYFCHEYEIKFDPDQFEYFSSVRGILELLDKNNVDLM